MSRKSFILYIDDMTETLAELTDAEAGELIKAITLYERSRYDEASTAPLFKDRTLRMTFNRIAAQLDRDAAKWAKTSGERMAAGRKGGLISGEIRRSKCFNRKANEANALTMKQNEANEAVNVNVNVNDNVNVPVNVSQSMSILDMLTEEEYRRIENNCIDVVSVTNKIDEKKNLSEIKHPFQYFKAAAIELGCWIE